jgi:hypothetical protein
MIAVAAGTFQRDGTVATPFSAVSVVANPRAQPRALDILHCC